MLSDQLQMFNVGAPKEIILLKKSNLNTPTSDSPEQPLPREHRHMNINMPVPAGNASIGMAAFKPSTEIR